MSLDGSTNSSDGAVSRTNKAVKCLNERFKTKVELVRLGFKLIKAWLVP